MKLSDIGKGVTNLLRAKLGVPNEEIEALHRERILICEACPHNVARPVTGDRMCNLCKCNIAAKTRCNTCVCPDKDGGRW
jgi:hypothetical protein